MAAGDRLSIRPVATAALPPEHLQRYELVAPLCDGMRVLELACGERRGTAILGARAETILGVDGEEILEMLGRELTGDFDVIVCLAGLETLLDPSSVASALQRHALAGLGLAVSIAPGTDGLERLERLENTLVLEQFLAEASVVRNREGEALAVDLREEAQTAAPVCFIVLSGLRAPENAARLLELANTELRKVNARLGRGLLASSNSAASATLARLQAELDEAREGRHHAETLAREAFDREKAVRAQLGARRLSRAARRLARRLRRRRRAS